MKTITRKFVTVVVKNPVGVNALVKLTHLQPIIMVVVDSLVVVGVNEETVYK
jgi:hypothetical protein